MVNVKFELGGKAMAVAIITLGVFSWFATKHYQKMDR